MMEQATDTQIETEIGGIATLDPTGVPQIEKDELQRVLRLLGGSKLSGFVKNVAVAYVATNGNNSTAEVGNPYRPYLTIDAALDATAAAPARVIVVGLGTFASPTREKILSNTAIIGSGKPVANFSATGSTYPNVTLGAPTALIGGTIFNGAFWVPFNVSNITLRDFGVDCGPTWCNTFNGGAAVDGLLIPANNGTTNPSANGAAFRANIIVENIACMVKDPTSLFHACLIEKCFEPVVRNIDTWFGFAGLVSKNIGGQITQIKAHQHNTYGIIIKQNDYAYSYHTILDGFEIRGGAGLALHNQDGSGGLGMVGAKATNGKIINCTSGVFQESGNLQKITLDAIDVVNCSGIGFNLPNFDNGKVMNCTVDGATTGYNVTGGNTRIHNSSAINTSSNGFNVAGLGATSRMIVTDCDCPGEVFVAGSHVYGNSNYYQSLSGVINAL